jgi:membrane fusion protein (multidrug efflux system)
MRAPFASSLRTLAAERGRGLELALVLTLALLLAWGGWVACAEVVLVEVSVRASVESVAAAVPVTTLVEGRVVAVHLGLGRRVAADEVLVTLETHHLQLEREGLVAALVGLRTQLAASTREHTTITAAIATHERGGRARTLEALASAREAEVEVALAAGLAARDSELAKEEVESVEAAEQSQTALLGRQARVAAHHWQVSRTTAELHERVAMLRVDLTRLERRQSQLRSELERQEAALAVLDGKLTEHRIRAPIAGILGQAPPLHPGAVLTANSSVAQIVPDGALRIVASFRPAATGRVAPGQPVRLRLDGFPWTAYGSLRGTVVAVAGEAVGGSLRVECSLDPTSAPTIPLAHGLVGTLEVEIERLSPAALLTRSAGRTH